MVDCHLVCLHELSCLLCALRHLHPHTRQRARACLCDPPLKLVHGCLPLPSVVQHCKQPGGGIIPSLESQPNWENNGRGELYLAGRGILGICHDCQGRFTSIPKWLRVAPVGVVAATREMYSVHLTWSRVCRGRPESQPSISSLSRPTSSTAPPINFPSPPITSPSRQITTSTSQGDQGYLWYGGGRWRLPDMALDAVFSLHRALRHRPGLSGQQSVYMYRWHSIPESDGFLLLTT